MPLHRSTLLLAIAAVSAVAATAYLTGKPSAPDPLLERVLSQQQAIQRELSSTRDELRRTRARLASSDRGRDAVVAEAVQRAVQAGLGSGPRPPSASAEPSSRGERIAADPSNEGPTPAQRAAEVEGRRILADALDMGLWDANEAGAFRQQVMQLPGPEHDALMAELITAVNQGDLELDPHMEGLF